jgi:hypothetical protein
MLKKLNNQKGQGLMEYIILSCLIGVFSLIAVKEFGGTIKKRVEFMKKSITKNINI